MRSLKTIQLEMEKDRFMDYRSKLVARREGNNSCTRMKYRDTRALPPTRRGKKIESDPR